MVWYKGVVLIKCKCDHCGGKLIRRAGPGIPPVKARFCDNVCKGAAQKTVKPVSAEWLREHYVDKGMDCTQIAALVNRDPKTVWEWVRDAGIATRKRGSTGNWKFVVPRRGFKLSDKQKQGLREARIKDGRIPAYINGVHWMKALGRKSGNWKGGLTPERQAFYSTTEWASAVKSVWKRDDGKCRKCGLDHRDVDRKKIAFHIHHIDSFMIRQRRAAVDNLVLLCQHCHRWVHGKKNTQREFIGNGH